MKPRNKEQERLVKWSNHFQPLTDRQKQYAIRHCFDNDFVFASRGWLFYPKTNTCWKGGTQQHVKELSDIKSMHTNYKEVTVLHKSALHTRAYFLLITTKDGYQVGRWFLVDQWLHVNWKSTVKLEATYYFDPVGVEWLKPDGTLFSVEKSRFTMCWEIDRWKYGDMELRQRSLFARCIAPDACMIVGVIPVIKRNGWNNKAMRNELDMVLLRQLIVNRNFESWYKCGHYGVCREFMLNNRGAFVNRTSRVPNASDDTLLLIKLANRHHVHFSTLEQWRDMKDYLTDLKYMHMDYHNPAILFPDDFQKAHLQLHKRARKRRVEENRRIMEQEHLREMRHKMGKETVQQWISKYSRMFDDMDIHVGDFEVKPLIETWDFSDEADCMHHCIVTYYGKRDTLLLSVRHNGERCETAEIDLLNGYLVQCRGKYNQPSPYHDRIVGILKHNMNDFLRRYHKGLKTTTLPVLASMYNQYKIAI